MTPTDCAFRAINKLGGKGICRRRSICIDRDISKSKYCAVCPKSKNRCGGILCVDGDVRKGAIRAGSEVSTNDVAIGRVTFNREIAQF